MHSEAKSEEKSEAGIGTEGGGEAEAGVPAAEDCDNDVSANTVHLFTTLDTHLRNGSALADSIVASHLLLRYRP